jgi:hypothetical protein
MSADTIRAFRSIPRSACTKLDAIDRPGSRECQNESSIHLLLLPCRNRTLCRAIFLCENRCACSHKKFSPHKTVRVCVQKWNLTSTASKNKVFVVTMTWDDLHRGSKKRLVTNSSPKIGRCGSQNWLVTDSSPKRGRLELFFGVPRCGTTRELKGAR